MLPNPFSEEDAQRYIAEFKSWPHEFPPDQLVYAGFRSAATPSSADKVNCYGCSAFVEQWHDPSKALQEHLRQTPACPIALEIKQSRLEIEAEIRQITLAQLVKQRDIRRKSALKILAAPQQQALLPSIENSHSVETKDTYLLQLYRNRATLLASSPWHFSGMHLLPVSPLIPALDIAVYNFPSGLLEAIEEVLGEEFMDGWFVRPVSLFLSAVSWWQR